MLGGPEDEEPGLLTCSTVATAELPGEAEIARPALHGGEDGLTVAWVVRERGERVFRVAWLDRDLGIAGEPEVVDPGDGDGMPLWPAVARCGGTTLLAWQQQGRSADAVELASRSDDGTWTRQAARQGARAPALACSGDRGALVWSRRSSGIQDVFLAWVPGSEAGHELPVSGETDAAATPAVACAAARCAVVWSDMREGVPEIYGTLVPSLADRVSDHVRLSASNRAISGAGGAYMPSVAAGDGGFLVAWHDGRSQDESQIYAVAWRGGLASGDRRISASTAPATAAALASCGATRLVAWRDRRAGPRAVQVAALAADATRRSAVFGLSRADEEASGPATACAGSGLAVAWTAQTPAGGVLRVASVVCARAR